jgi:hypothetical protein
LSPFCTAAPFCRCHAADCVSSPRPSCAEALTLWCDSGLLCRQHRCCSGPTRCGREAAATVICTHYSTLNVIPTPLTGRDRPGLSLIVCCGAGCWPAAAGACSDHINCFFGSRYVTISRHTTPSSIYVATLHHSIVITVYMRRARRLSVVDTQ